AAAHRVHALDHDYALSRKHESAPDPDPGLLQHGPIPAKLHDEYLHFVLQLEARGASMKREKGFSLIELLVAMAILLVVVSVATGVIIQAQHVSEAVALEGNVQENLRAGM